MVEVFKTNVKKQRHAKMLTDHIHAVFSEYKANFDLQDCENILRVKSNNGIVKSSSLVNILNNFGFKAEVLHDIPPTVS